MPAVLIISEFIYDTLTLGYEYCPDTRRHQPVGFARQVGGIDGSTTVGQSPLTISKRTIYDEKVANCTRAVLAV
jgi:hypothetical protein